jgi:tetratricopeptide (TPR) repeat protein
MQALLRWILLFVLVVVNGAMAQDKDMAAEIVAALRQGHAAEAEDLCDVALSRSPTNPRLWTLKGIGFDSLGQYSDALKAYYRALAIAPDYLSALEGAAQDEFRQGSQKAVPLLEHAEKLRPEDSKIFLMLGTLAFLRSDCQKAVAYFERDMSLTQSKPQAMEQYGSCLVQINQAKRAVPIFEGLFNQQPQNEAARYNFAFVQLQAGQYSDVLRTLAPLTDRDPPDSDSLSLLVQAYQSILDTPHAVETLQRAMAAYPLNPEFYVSFATISLAHRSFQVGVDVLNVGIARLPSEASLYFARGVLYLELDQYQKSEEDFDRAEVLNPQLPFGSAALGLSKLQLRQPAEAEKIARLDLAKNPDDPYLNYVLAESIRQQGFQSGTPEFKLALSAAEKSVRLQPDYSRARQLLSRLYLANGKYELAIEQGREAIERAPEDQEALYQLILAMKRAGKTAEIPGLLKQFQDLRQASFRKQDQLRKYTLVEGNSGGADSH